MSTPFVRALCGALALTGAAIADTQTYKVARIGHRTIDLASGEITRGDVAQRGYSVCWDTRCTSGYFQGAEVDELILQWGDLPSDCGVVDSFRFGYGTNAPGPQSIDIVFYLDDDGWCEQTHFPAAAVRLKGLPGSNGDTAAGWVITVIPDPPIDLADASDLDGDGMGDFSYSFHFRTPRNEDELIGPLVGLDPNCAAPGIEHAFEFYSPEDWSPGPNEVWLAGLTVPCAGTYYFEAAFFFMSLFREDASVPGPGCNACPGDIEPPDGDYDVDLSDLAALLSHYGLTSGATCNQGDIQPAGGDGDVDLSDLALMLGRFGTPCFNPPMP